LSAFLAEAGRAALKADPVEKKHTFELLTYGDSGTYPGIDLDKTNALLAAEDEGSYRS
jgi:hypothetical protein